MFLQFVFIFVIGLILGGLVAYELICLTIQHGVDSGKIKFEILRKGK